MAVLRSLTIFCVAVAGVLGCSESRERDPSDTGVDALSDDPAPSCAVSADCDDGLFCNGLERCAPGAVEADRRGCAPGVAPCGTWQTCSEAQRVCVGCDSDRDLDGDGADALACGGADCDDNDPSVSPGAPELCNDRDEDCDPTTLGVRDSDGDGETDRACCNPTVSGSTACGSDCDDARASRRSGQIEFCDGQDNDCDGAIDEDAAAVPWFADRDGDGFGARNEAPVESCTPRPGRSLLASDCDDTRVGVSPVGHEACGNGRDDDCDGLTDRQDDDCAPIEADAGVSDSGAQDAHVRSGGDSGPEVVDSGEREDAGSVSELDAAVVDAGEIDAAAADASAADARPDDASVMDAGEIDAATADASAADASPGDASVIAPDAGDIADDAGVDGGLVCEVAAGIEPSVGSGSDGRALVVSAPQVLENLSWVRGYVAVTPHAGRLWLGVGTTSCGGWGARVLSFVPQPDGTLTGLLAGCEPAASGAVAVSIAAGPGLAMCSQTHAPAYRVRCGLVAGAPGSYSTTVDLGQPRAIGLVGGSAAGYAVHRGTTDATRALELVELDATGTLAATVPLASGHYPGEIHRIGAQWWSLRSGVATGPAHTLVLDRVAAGTLVGSYTLPAIGAIGSTEVRAITASPDGARLAIEVSADDGIYSGWLDRDSVGVRRVLGPGYRLMGSVLVPGGRLLFTWTDAPRRAQVTRIDCAGRVMEGPRDLGAGWVTRGAVDEHGAVWVVLVESTGSETYRLSAVSVRE